MNRNDALSLCKKSLDDLEKQLAAGNSIALERYLTALARFHEYSFRNIMLIVSQMPEAQQVAGIRVWNKLKRCVRKGEKGICIIAPMTCKKAQETEVDTAEDRDGCYNFRAVFVFDISQTEGEALPEIAKVQGDPAHYLNPLKTAILKKGISLEYAADLGSALGKSHGGKIEIVQGLSIAEEYSILAHEFAHELLHPKGVRPTVRQREMEAEAVAHAVCTFAGLDCGTAHADYIRLYQGDAESFRASLNAIQSAAHAIIQGIVDCQEPTD